VKVDGWGEVYEDLGQSLAAYVQEARLTICGLSTFLDGYVRLHQAERLLNAAKRWISRACASTLTLGRWVTLSWPGPSWSLVERSRALAKFQH
jgi:hypothetical protein